jgi:hypothetical protein
MNEKWRVHTTSGVAYVPYSLALIYADARQRVLASRRLWPHYDLLLGDGYASDEDHLRWVVSGRVGEIEAWAQQMSVGL